MSATKNKGGRPRIARGLQRSRTFTMDDEAFDLLDAIRAHRGERSCSETIRAMTSAARRGVVLEVPKRRNLPAEARA